MSLVRTVGWPGWETVRRIGSGGFGTVYEIQQDIYGDVEKAALKVITIPHCEDEVDYLRCKGLTDDNITQTFHRQVADISREYKLMAKMRDNPNVVRCDDFRDIPHEDGLCWDIYIKMELLTPLMKCLDKVQTEEQIRRLGMDMCNALVACQEKNIIHRDIKPQNIFLSDKGQFKLGDFGIARTAERTTRATAGIGTYSYMAPEVEKNEAYGKTADIYSLGLVLYWLLNERRSPFEPLPPAVPGYGDEENARNRRFSGEQIPAPKNGSEELKAIVLKACAYDPRERYQSAKDMLSALEALKVDTAPVEEPVPVTVAVPTEDAVEPEDLTVGPGWGNTVKQTAADDSMTVGPSWHDIPTTEDKDVTVGPVFHEKETKHRKTDSSGKPKEKQPTPQKKKWWVIATAILVCVGIGISLLKKPTGGTVTIDQLPQEKTADRELLQTEEEIPETIEKILDMNQLHQEETVTSNAETTWNVISVSEGHAVGITTDGAVIALGDNNYGQCDVDDWQGTVDVSAGYHYTVGLKADGSVVAVGENGLGQCDVNDWQSIVDICTGNLHTVALKDDGTVVAAGYNKYGQCDVNSWQDIVAISAGGDHTVGLKADGTVVAIGDNAAGQCDVNDWQDIVAISAGFYHTVGLKADGTVVAVGENRYGNCNVDLWRDVVAICAAVRHTVGLRADGTVVAVGYGDYRCNVRDWQNIVAISAANRHTIGIKADGTIIAVEGNHTSYLYNIQDLL